MRCDNCKRIDKVEVGAVLICPKCDGDAAMIAVKNEARKEGGS
jgi:hypothetical protein